MLQVVGRIHFIAIETWNAHEATHIKENMHGYLQKYVDDTQS